jgi:hypothetical protein
LGRPRYFSIPEWWMPGIHSACIGFKNIRRYPCTL